MLNINTYKLNQNHEFIFLLHIKPCKPCTRRRHNFFRLNRYYKILTTRIPFTVNKLYKWWKVGKKIAFCSSVAVIALKLTLTQRPIPPHNKPHKCVANISVTLGWQTTIPFHESPINFFQNNLSSTFVIVKFQMLKVGKISYLLI